MNTFSEMLKKEERRQKRKYKQEQEEHIQKIYDEQEKRTKMFFAKQAQEKREQEEEQQKRTNHLINAHNLLDRYSHVLSYKEWIIMYDLLIKYDYVQVKSDLRKNRITMLQVENIISLIMDNIEGLQFNRQLAYDSIVRY